MFGAVGSVAMAVVGLIIGTVVGSIAQPGPLNVIETIGVVLWIGSSGRMEDFLLLPK